MQYVQIPLRMLKRGSYRTNTTLTVLKSESLHIGVNEAIADYGDSFSCTRDNIDIGAVLQIVLGNNSFRNTRRFGVVFLENDPL